jgi:hypothetical protein
VAAGDGPDALRGAARAGGTTSVWAPPARWARARRLHGRRSSSCACSTSRARSCEGGNGGGRRGARMSPRLPRAPRRPPLTVPSVPTRCRSPRSASASSTCTSCAPRPRGGTRGGCSVLSARPRAPAAARVGDGARPHRARRAARGRRAPRAPRGDRPRGRAALQRDQPRPSTSTTPAPRRRGSGSVQVGGGFCAFVRSAGAALGGEHWAYAWLCRRRRPPPGSLARIRARGPGHVRTCWAPARGPLEDVLRVR